MRGMPRSLRTGKSGEVVSSFTHAAEVDSAQVHHLTQIWRGSDKEALDGNQ
ncbi:hypothetical protein thalar_00231 [Litoreibacter arenae DSM 19593]|uniref:Uncharacterized protein n=1 Tax=Litoreibacter arenae DSM 19593 TaxID=1123360 RepID=S9RUG8_9RHOB|nr:hypothetical protein thalar_00231 [Litoreibacter arenae DSM 19593]